MTEDLTAKDALAEAQEIARREGPRGRPGMFEHFTLQIARAQWEAGDRAEALESLAPLETAADRWQLEAVSMWAGAGDADRAAAIASRMPENVREEARTNAAYALMEAGHAEAAMEMIAGVTGEDRTRAVAVLLARNPDLDGMERGLQRWLTPDQREAPIVHHCRSRAYARAGRSDEALAILAEDADAETRRDLLSWIALDLADAGHMAQASDVLRQMMGLYAPGEMSDGTLSSLVYDLGRAGAFDDALRLAMTLTGQARDETMMRLASRQREAGQLVNAEVALKQVPRGFERRSFEARAILVERIRRGQRPARAMGWTLNPENAGFLLTETLGKYRNTPPAIARAMVDESLSLARRIPDSYWRRQHLLWCAGDYARLGDFKRAQSLYRPFAKDVDSLPALATLAASAQKHGRLELAAERAAQAVRLAATADGDGQDPVHVRVAVHILHDEGLLDAALAMVQRMNPDGVNRHHLAMAQRSLSLALIGAGRLRDAFGITAQIDDANERQGGWLDIYKVLRTGHQA